MEKSFAGLGIRVPEILLPDQQIDLTKWSVVACDQYTSQPEYWEKAAELVGDHPSTLHLIYPEVYLGKEDGAQRILKIQQNMHDYLDNNILKPQGLGFVFVNRKTSHAPSRKGLIVALDLECYDYHLGSQTLIRATEGTVLERIPPRVRIREEAIIEVPHIMVLIDDPQKTIIEPIADRLSDLKQLYDVNLMLDGGHVEGYMVDQDEIINNILGGLQTLADKKSYNKRYGLEDREVLLYAVGDGNHSLATAKAVWEKVKQNSQSSNLENHPARFALVELVNIHDPGIAFESIHRVVFHVNFENMLTAMADFYNRTGSGFRYCQFSNEAEFKTALSNHLSNSGTQVFSYVIENSYGIIEITRPSHNLEVGTLQAFLDDYIKDHPGMEVDYIHGDDVVSKLGSQTGNAGFYLPPMEKSALFKTVIVDGVLPRKTFSMGEAEEKRFYMECRKIVQL